MGSDGGDALRTTCSTCSSRRGWWLRALILTGLACFTGVSAQTDDWGATGRDYDASVTFVRLRWGGGGFGGGFGGRRGFGGNSSAWNHDFPRAEQNLMSILKELTLINPNVKGSLILSLDDPQLFKYPVAMMWEPGFWEPTDEELAALRAYLLKGGFAIFDDFEMEQWDNFEFQMRRALPEFKFIKLDRSHPIFDVFFRMKTIDFPHPMYPTMLPNYFALFEDNDPSKRMLVIANHNNDVAEYWEFAGEGLFPVDPSNEAYKLGVNYYIYALTH
jgi:hypothetical protein